MLGRKPWGVGWLMFYTCRECFDDDDGDRWSGYLKWLGRLDIARLVTLDSMLCPPLVRIEDDSDWGFAVCEDFMLDFFTDLGFVLARVTPFPRRLVLAAALEPSAEDVSGFSLPGFDFAGFDLLDRQCCASALLNCGGFPDVFSIGELSTATGLILSRERALEIQRDLLRLHPENPHADCNVWALWRRVGAV